LQVKTQRAISDYRKCEYPHYKDELTKLKFVGNITALRLRDIQMHLGQNAPFSSITTGEGVCAAVSVWGWVIRRALVGETRTSMPV